MFAQLNGGMTKSSLAPDADMMTHLQEALQRYIALWAGWADEVKNPEQLHDENLARTKLRPAIRSAFCLQSLLAWAVACSASKLTELSCAGRLFGKK